MPTPQTQHGALQQELRFRNRIIGLLGALLGVFGAAYWRLPTLLSVYVPPDLSRPQTVAPGEIPPSYVYAFGKLILEALNYCPEDCARDYRANIEALRHYLTTPCLHDLHLHREKNASLYEFRTRRLLPVGEEIYAADKVRRLDQKVWEVNLDYLLEEHVKGVETRRNRYYYPLRIVHYRVPIEQNAYQLAFDCYVPPGPRPAEAVPTDTH